MQLVEATNLLRVPGRLVARTGEKSENPRIELEPETMQKMIAEDPVTWRQMVDRLHDAAVPALKAIDARNAKGLFDAGEHIEKACEAAISNTGIRRKKRQRGNTSPGGRIDDSAVASVQAVKRGTLRGHIRCERKGARQSRHPDGDRSDVREDQCRKAPRPGGRRRSADGSLANVFVRLQGSFPPRPSRRDPVTIDQRACIYVPLWSERTSGRRSRCGTATSCSTTFTALRPAATASTSASRRRGSCRSAFEGSGDHAACRCDVHRWMTAFVGVVSHPYLATSGAAGTYTIGNVPAGTHTIQAWHEQYGVLTQRVTVTSGPTTTVDFSYN